MKRIPRNLLAPMLALAVALAPGAVRAKPKGDQGGTPPQQQQGSGQRESMKQRFRELPPDQQQEIRERLQRFRGLPPEKQDAVRERYRSLRELPPDQRQQLERNRERWKQLSPDQKQEMRQRMRELQSLPPEQRRKQLEQ
jgi:hypothetical protein